MKIRAILTLLLGIIQSLLSFSVMCLGVVLYFNIFDVQMLWGIPREATSFHLAILLTFGVFFITSGLFLINEWRETQ